MMQMSPLEYKLSGGLGKNLSIESIGISNLEAGKRQKRRKRPQNGSFSCFGNNLVTFDTRN